AAGSESRGIAVLMELELIAPSHVCMPAADIGVIEVANPVFDGASLFACVMPHDVTKPECVGIAFTREHLLNQGGTVRKAIEPARAGRGELALRQHMTSGYAGQGVGLVDRVLEGFVEGIQHPC